MSLTTLEKCKIVEYLQKTQPGIIADAEEQIRKPGAEFNHFFLLLKVLNEYCHKRGFEPDHITGVHISRHGILDRTIFIAVCLKLYCPEIFIEGVSYDIRNNLREEIAGMLEISTPNWISQQIGGIIVSMKAYKEFKDQVNSMVDHIKRTIHIKEMVEEKQTELYQ